MIYFTYNPNNAYYHAFLFKSDVSTQELDKFFSKNQGVNVIPHLLYSNRSKGRSTNESFGIFYKVSVSISQSRIDSLEEDFKGQLKYMEYDDWYKMAISTQKKYEDNYNPSNEKDIREKSTALLKELHNIKFLENEYTHTSLPVRADIMAVSHDKEVIALEIKSDKDTFVRLEKQLKEYMNFSHIVYIAIDILHLPKFLKKFNTYSFDTIGIMVYEDNEVYVYREPYKRTKINVTSLLWKNEYLQFLECFPISASKLSVDRALEIINRCYTVYEFETICEQIFINRYLQNKDFKVNDFLEDKEYKSKKIQKFYKELK